MVGDALRAERRTPRVPVRRWESQDGAKIPRWTDTCAGEPLDVQLTKSHLSSVRVRQRPRSVVFVSEAMNSRSLVLPALLVAACGGGATMTPTVAAPKVDNPLTTGAALTYARELYDASMCSQGPVESRYELEVEPRRICLTLKMVDEATGRVRYRVSSDGGSTDSFLLAPTGEAAAVNECALDKSKPVPVVAQTFHGCTDNPGIVTADSREVVLVNVLPGAEEHVAYWSLETKSVVVERPVARTIPSR
jgi:hypothetical protein